MSEARQRLEKQEEIPAPRGWKHRAPRKEMVFRRQPHCRDENYRGPASSFECWSGAFARLVSKKKGLLALDIRTMTISAFSDASRWSIEEHIVFYIKRQTHELAASFLNNNGIRKGRLHKVYFPLIKCHFQQEIAWYEVDDEGIFWLKYEICSFGLRKNWGAPDEHLHLQRPRFPYHKSRNWQHYALAEWQVNISNPNCPNCFVAGRVWKLPANVPGAGDENSFRLVRVLIQPGCRARSGSPGVHARLLHRAARCTVAAGGLDEISPLGHVETN